jgi:pyrophosphatase PpaX
MLGPVAARRPAILFDLDGTLVDTVPFILASVRHAFDGYGTCPTDAEWIAGIGTPLRAQLGQLARRPEDVEPLYQRYRAFWLAHHDELTRCFPGALELVRGLAAAGHPIGVVTAKVETGALRTLGHTGLLPFVGAVVGADSCARPKPDPEPVRLALSRLGREPSEALLVGDSPHDIAAGNGAGATTVAALWGACSREALAAARPHHFAAALADLPALIDRLAEEPGEPARARRLS